MQNNSKATVGTICGIVSIIVGIIGGLTFGVIGGSIALVLGIVGIVFGALFTIACAVCGSGTAGYGCYGCIGGPMCAADDVEDAANELNDILNGRY